jgi:hypothetical protein
MCCFSVVPLIENSAERTTVRHYARSVGTLPNKGNNNGTVLQGAFKRESPQKHKTDKKLNHLSFQSTEQLKNNTFMTWYRHFPRKMVGSDSR